MPRRSPPHGFQTSSLRLVGLHAQGAQGADKEGSVTFTLAHGPFTLAHGPGQPAQHQQRHRWQPTHLGVLPGLLLAYLPRHRRRHDPGQRQPALAQPPRRPIGGCPPPRPCGRFAPTTEAFGRRHVPSRAQPRRRSIRCFKRLAAKTGLKNQSASPGLLEFPPASGGPRSRTAAAHRQSCAHACAVLAPNT
jgi:hypothetical protein